MKVKVYAHSASMDFSCCLCGRFFQQTNFAAALLPDGEDDVLGDDDTLDVCPQCLEAGPTGAAERARLHAEELRDAARALDTLAGEVATIPESDWVTPEEYQAEGWRLVSVMEDEPFALTGEARAELARRWGLSQDVTDDELRAEAQRRSTGPAK